MQKPSDYIEFFLQPGEFMFADNSTRLRTLLGSCVTITIWRRRFKFGAMSHYLVPTRGTTSIDQLDGRYCDESLMMFLREALEHDSDPNEYELKLFGGGNMFPALDHKRQGGPPIGMRNVARAKELLWSMSLKISVENTGGNGHRMVMLDCWSGDVWLLHDKIEEPTRIAPGVMKRKVMA